MPTVQKRNELAEAGHPVVKILHSSKMYWVSTFIPYGSAEVVQTYVTNLREMGCVAFGVITGGNVSRRVDSKNLNGKKEDK